MAKVILVLDTDYCPQSVTFHRGLLENPSEYIVISSGTDEDRRMALADKVAAGDEVIAYRFIRNDEGVAVGQHYAIIQCYHGIEKILKDRLLRANAQDKAYDIISVLARNLVELAQKAG